MTLKIVLFNSSNYDMQCKKVKKMESNFNYENISYKFIGLPSRLEREIKQLYLERVLKGNSERLSKFKIRFEVLLLPFLPCLCVNSNVTFSELRIPLDERTWCLSVELC